MQRQRLKINQKGCNTGLVPMGSPCTYSQEELVPKGKPLNDNVVARRLKGNTRNEEVHNDNNNNHETT